MLVDVSIHPKVWGTEKWFANFAYCGKILELKKQYRCSFHCHVLKHETFYVVSGTVFFEVALKKVPEGFGFKFPLSLGLSGFEEESLICEKVLRQGDAIVIVPETFHRFTGMSDSVIFEASTFHSDADVIRLTESEKVHDLEFERLRHYCCYW